MRIWPLVITISRDLGLYGLLEKSLRKMPYKFEKTTLSLDEKDVIDTDTQALIGQHGVTVARRRPGYGNWNGWDSCLVYFSVLTSLFKGGKIASEDYVMDVDADVVFLGTSFTEALDGSELVGVPIIGKSLEFLKYGINKWNHFSGAFLIIRGSLLQKISESESKGFPGLREEIKSAKCSLCDDVSISMYCLMNGLKTKPLDRGKTIQSRSEDIPWGKCRPSADIIHWEGSGRWKSFMGIPVNGRAEIPLAIKKAGVNWP